MYQRVVITGIGVISPIGIGKELFWEACLKGISGIRKISAFDAKGYKSQIAAEVADFRPSDFISDQKIHQMDRFAQFGVAAAKMALKDAGLEIEKMNPYRIGVTCGSGLGGMAIAENQLFALYKLGLPNKVRPRSIPMITLNAVSGEIAIEIGMKGPNLTVSTACSSGTHAIGQALNLIHLGKADVMVAGGAEACILPLTFAGFCALRTLSTTYNQNPQGASRPFDKNRDGFVIGEGAGFVMLESLPHARKRGARIYVELAGYGATSGAYHMVCPDVEGKEAAQTMEIALKDAGLTTGQIDYINAHATSTQIGDIAEINAIKRVFKERSYKIPVNSTKSLIGHTIGAAGAIEAIVCSLSIKLGQVHPTINYEVPDPLCDLDCVPNKAREIKIKAAISNSFGFGSNNAVLVFKDFTE